jgi:predicted kinase
MTPDGLNLSRSVPPGNVQPVVFMLCGMAGSGKTTFARKLERDGAVRLSIDERVFQRRGRHGIDYPEHEYPTHHEAALVELDRELVDLLVAGRDVVLDYGFWSRDSRDRYKAMAEAHGATWQLLYFEADPTLLKERLENRNTRGYANALIVEDHHLQEFMSRFDPPNGEDEQVIEQT